MVNRRELGICVLSSAMGAIGMLPPAKKDQPEPSTYDRVMNCLGCTNLSKVPFNLGANFTYYFAPYTLFIDRVERISHATLDFKTSEEIKVHLLWNPQGFQDKNKVYQTSANYHFWYDEDVQKTIQPYITVVESVRNAIQGGLDAKQHTGS